MSRYCLPLSSSHLPGEWLRGGSVPSRNAPLPPLFLMGVIWQPYGRLPTDKLPSFKGLSHDVPDFRPQLRFEKLSCASPGLRVRGAQQGHINA